MTRLDKTDIAILEQLQQNARITNAELARSVHLSPTPCFNRVRALEKLGLILRHVTLLDPQPLGLRITVFIHVSLEKQVEDALRRFEQAVSARPEVMECYLMSGDADYLVRVVVPDIEALQHFRGSRRIGDSNKTLQVSADLKCVTFLQRRTTSIKWTKPLKICNSP